MKAKEKKEGDGGGGKPPAKKGQSSAGKSKKGDMSKIELLQMKRTWHRRFSLFFLVLSCVVV